MLDGIAEQGDYSSQYPAHDLLGIHQSLQVSLQPEHDHLLTDLLW